MSTNPELAATVTGCADGRVNGERIAPKDGHDGATCAPAAAPARPSTPHCPKAGHPTIQHTRAADYNRGCRCPEARAQRRLQVKTRHLNPPFLVDITGTRRRLQALMAIGWRQKDLVAGLGREGRCVGPLLWSPRQATVTREIFDRVNDLYNQLWDKPGPSRRTARRAASNGWPLPLWWDDDLIDEPNYDASEEFNKYRNDMHNRTALRAAFDEEVAELTAQRLSAAQIAQRTGRSKREVVRARARLRAASVSPARTVEDVTEQVAC